MNYKIKFKVLMPTREKRRSNFQLSVHALNKWPKPKQKNVNSIIEH